MKKNLQKTFIIWEQSRKDKKTILKCLKGIKYGNFLTYFFNQYGTYVQGWEQIFAVLPPSYLNALLLVPEDGLDVGEGELVQGVALATPATRHLARLRLESNLNIKEIQLKHHKWKELPNNIFSLGSNCKKP